MVVVALLMGVAHLGLSKQPLQVRLAFRASRLRVIPARATAAVLAVATLAAAVAMALKLFPQLFATLQLSHIADAVGLKVFQFVASVAQRFTVVDVVHKFWVGPHRLYVVRAEVAASRVVAGRVLAGVVVSREHRLSPFTVFNRSAKVEISLGFSMLVRRVIHAARGAKPNSLTDFCPSLCCVFYAETKSLAFFRCTLLCLCLLGVFVAFEKRWLSGLEKIACTFVRVASAVMASPISFIRPIGVAAKVFTRSPIFALCAAIQTLRKQITIFALRHSSHFCCGFYCPFFGLSHR